ncbi:MAG: sulfide/dihydroorotate dehydrogenase-like FAD/NAD-binding protein [Planctomycetota bacterium]|nr:sulfide/dihydroorotate dehydrogenase-like FAD/NAD-binding protein [Planctomycetota bacterium]
MKAFQVVKKEHLSEQVWRMKIFAPHIAKKHKAGQFVILRVEEKGERIPLTVADSDSKAGVITLIFQVVGATTHKLSCLKEGDCLRDLVGPLGTPTHIEKYGSVVAVGGGIGIAPLYPIVKALKAAGNRLIGILGARTKSLLILEEEMRALMDETLISTDDGSYGERGVVTDVLKRLKERGEKIDLVIAIGPAIMMKFVCALTAEYKLPTLVSLNPIMVDGTGMCGACRVEIGGETKFACVDGPEFDGHKVNWDLLMKRLRFYNEQEKVSYELAKKCTCGGD